MKKGLIFLMFVFFSTQSFGQEIYKPFLEEGKIWSYNYHNFNGNTYNKSLIVKGDTLIGDKSYKRIVDLATNHFECLMREDGAKVFCSQNGNEYLVYDFSLSVGDTFETFETKATVAAVDTIIVGDHSFRILDVRENDNPQTNWWVEGIGSMNYLTNSVRIPGDYYTFLQCQIGENILFSQKDFETLAVQKLIIKRGNYSISSTYDLQGHRLNAHQSKGFYIQNGKKVVMK